MKGLTQEQVNKFNQDGYVCPIRAVPETVAGQYLQKLEAVEADHGKGLDRTVRAKCHLLMTWADELIRTPEILDVVEGLIGPDILCWSSQLFAKQPHTSDFVSWHQDSTYWGLNESSVVTAWVALTPSDPQNGNMRVVPGSHLQILSHRDTFAESNMLSRGQEIAVDVDEADAVDLTLRPGEMSIHHPLIIHGSRPNSASYRRVGFVIRYVPTRMRQEVGATGWATLVRGEDKYGHFQLLPRPEKDFDEKMMSFHHRISAEINERKAIITGAPVAG